MKWCQENETTTLKNEITTILRDTHAQCMTQLEQPVQNSQTNIHVKTNGKYASANTNGSANVNTNLNAKKNGIEFENTNAWSKLAEPTKILTRLVLVMIRHATVVTFYVIFIAIHALLRRVVSVSGFYNIVMILTSLMVYMIYPIGDTVYAICCSILTTPMFFCWYEKYSSKKLSKINHISVELAQSRSCKNSTNTSTTDRPIKRGKDDISRENSQMFQHSIMVTQENDQDCTDVDLTASSSLK